MAIKTYTDLGGEIVFEVADAYITSRTLYAEPFDDTLLLTSMRDGDLAAQFSITPAEFAALAEMVAELDRIGAFDGR